MNSGESSTKCLGRFLQRPAVESDYPNLSTPVARHVGGAILTLPGGSGGGLGRTVVSGTPGPEEVVGARWRGRPGQQVTRPSLPAAPWFPGPHARAAAGTRGRWQPLAPIREFHTRARDSVSRKPSPGASSQARAGGRLHRERLEVRDVGAPAVGPPPPRFPSRPSPP